MSKDMKDDFKLYVDNRRIRIIYTQFDAVICQDKSGKLIFRYDNARHKPALDFIDHKHESDGSVSESAEPAIADVIDEVISHI